MYAAMKEGLESNTGFRLPPWAASVTSLRFGRSQKRHLFLYSGIVFFVLWLSWLNGLHEKVPQRLEAWRSTAFSEFQTEPERDVNVHILIPATQGDVNLCKVLMSSAILGYNSPVILGWDEPLQDGVSHGGSHALKITKAFEYLSSIDESQDEDIVLIIDAFDIQFQLPPDILIERFARVMAESNTRLKAELGNAFNAESIRNTIFFGAAKRHWPNPFEEISAWTVPESPAPHDIYGENTDTSTGYTEYYSRRQRFLNSGFLIGQLGATRKLYARAIQRLDVVSAYSDSDQSLLSMMMGEQSHWRERMRLKHVSWWSRLWGTPKPRDNWVDGVYINNILDPDMKHIPFTPSPDVDYEFGISLDYLIDFSHQTSGSEISRDSTWLSHTGAIDGLAALKRSKFDCKVRASAELPHDIASLPGPYSILAQTGTSRGTQLSPHAARLVETRWSEIPLYTHLCYGSIPIFVHHNGDKTMRRLTWPYMWYQSDAKELLAARMEEDASAEQKSAQISWEEFKKQPSIVEAGGAWSGNGTWFNWTSICPAVKYGKELFRSADPKDWI